MTIVDIITCHIVAFLFHRTFLIEERFSYAVGGTFTAGVTSNIRIKGRVLAMCMYPVVHALVARMWSSAPFAH